jgi:hypothetical protein
MEILNGHQCVWMAIEANWHRFRGFQKFWRICVNSTRRPTWPWTPRLRQEAERKPDSIISQPYARLVAECKAVRAEIVELTHAVLANQQPQGSAHSRH